MAGAAWLQLLALVACIAVSTRVLGPYLAGVFGDDEKTYGDRLFLKVERPLYRLCGVDPSREQRWSTYAYSLLAFSAVSVLVVYAIQRLQGSLPFNPTAVGGVPEALSFNTAVSFVTNTNWQNYAGESTMSYFTQMAGLAVQNFVSAAVGLTVAVALIRGLARRRAATIGNFWVDLVRGTVRVLLPLAVVVTVVLLSQGALQTLRGPEAATTLEQATQSIPGGPFASQEAIKELGTNGGGTLNANSAHPFENPNGFTNLLQMAAILLIPFALTYAYGRMVKDQKQGWVVFGAMFVLWAGSVAIATGFEVGGNQAVDDLGVNVTQEVTDQQAGGNMEGKEVRFGPAASGLFAATTTGTSTGAVISSHDSFTPLGGAAPLGNMMLGEVSPGGVGAGLYGMLIFALLAVFIAGLMVGRTPEFLGKKIQATEMKLVVLYILAVPLAVLGFAGASVLLDSAYASILPGHQGTPHGLTEVTYAFTSAANNNGSAFGGLTGNTDWYNATLGLSMLIGRFLLIVPALAIAGSLARKQATPPSAGTFPTSTPLFCGLLVGVVLIVVGLTYFPVLALGPIVEQLSL
jgi:K+-transporting ATPase ATPase A chain